MNKQTLKKVILTLILMLAIFAVFSVKTQAATEADVKAVVFDGTYYLNKYADLKAAFGNDEAAAYEHFLTYGIKEGREASPIFDIKYYIASNADLQNAYGAQGYEGAYEHFNVFGLQEGRSGSPLYNMGYYRKANKDVDKAYGTDNAKVYVHYALCGVKEGRQACDWYNVHCYVNSYSDLKATFGKNWEAGLEHYQLFVASGKEQRAHVMHERKEQVKAATCTATGSRKVVCGTCGEVLEEKVLPVVAHKGKVTKEAKTATCTETGWTQEVKCSVCGKTLEESKTVKTTEHKWEDQAITKEATCTEEGAKTQKCADCGKTQNVTIPALGHDFSGVVANPGEDNHTLKCVHKDCEEVSVPEACTYNWTQKSKDTLNFSDGVTNETKVFEGTCKKCQNKRDGSVTEVLAAGNDVKLDFGISFLNKVVIPEGVTLELNGKIMGTEIENHGVIRVNKIGQANIKNSGEIYAKDIESNAKIENLPVESENASRDKGYVEVVTNDQAVITKCCSYEFISKIILKGYAGEGYTFDTPLSIKCKDVEIDLNGAKIKKSNKNDSDETVVKILDNSKVTIKNGTISNESGFVGPSSKYKDSAVYVENAELTCENMKIEGASGIHTHGKSTLELIDSEVIANAYVTYDLLAGQTNECIGMGVNDPYAESTLILKNTKLTANGNRYIVYNGTNNTVHFLDDVANESMLLKSNDSSTIEILKGE